MIAVAGDDPAERRPGPAGGELQWDPVTVRVSWVGIALAAWVSPARPGTSVCWSKWITGIPCPGCGITRSMSCALRGMFHESLHFHPFGPVVLAAFVVMASSSLLPAAGKRRLQAAASGMTGPIRAAKYAFLVGFLAYGFLRAGLHIFRLADFGL